MAAGQQPGDPTGDRLVRILRELIEKYFDVTEHEINKIKDIMKTVIDTRNGSSYRTLNNRSTNHALA